MAANAHCIAFATAGELWNGALNKRWDGARRGALDLWLAKEMILPADLQGPRPGARSPPERIDVGGPGH